MNLSSITKTYGIALTGGIASGKSTVGKILREEHFTVIDADQASRLVTLPGTEGLKEVVDAFGKTILSADGTMDRAALRKIVFSDPLKRQTLESIIHHRLEAITEDLLKKADFERHPNIWFYEASLIYERKREQDFRSVWVAYCPPAVQLSRLMTRDKTTKEDAEKILAAQLSPEFKKSRADWVIETDCDEDELIRRIDNALVTQRITP